MKIFVTSNLQLGRPNAIKKFKRPFEDVNEMNNAIIRNWNRVVSEGDLVYHLGNFAWDPKTAQDAISALKGNIRFIEGEHDESIAYLDEKQMLPKNAKIVSRIEVDHNVMCTLSYWPMLTWPKSESDYYSVIGIPDDKYKSDPEKMIINVNADKWNYTPQELNKTIDIFKDF